MNGSKFELGGSQFQPSIDENSEIKPSEPMCQFFAVKKKGTNTIIGSYPNSHKALLAVMQLLGTKDRFNVYRDYEIYETNEKEVPTINQSEGNIPYFSFKLKGGTIDSIGGSHRTVQRAETAAMNNLGITKEELYKKYERYKIDGNDVHKALKKNKIS